MSWRWRAEDIAVTISAVAFAMLAVALAPGVPTVLATVRTSVATDDAKLNQPLAQLSYAAFETWFLDATCADSLKSSGRV